MSESKPRWKNCGAQIPEEWATEATDLAKRFFGTRRAQRYIYSVAMQLLFSMPDAAIKQAALDVQRNCLDWDEFVKQADQLRSRAEKNPLINRFLSASGLGSKPAGNHRTRKVSHHRKTGGD